MVFVEQYASNKSAADKNDVSYNDIRACCRGERKSAGGFIWRYVDKSDTGSPTE